MQRIIEIFLVCAVVFALIDFVWLTAVAKKFYYKHLGFVLREKANIPASVAFYVIYIVGLMNFVMWPALNIGPLHAGAQGLWFAVINGALYGFFCYATYDLTNLATIRNWPKVIVFVDLAWGTILTGTVAGVSYVILQNI